MGGRIVKAVTVIIILVVLPETKFVACMILMDMPNSLAYGDRTKLI
jgi:hypothetical protein